MNTSHSLALFGGTPVRTQPLPQYNTIGEAETRAALAVLKTRNLSGFQGTYDERFFGGPFVRTFEKEFEQRFKIKYAISFNSATTALQAALDACGIVPGDEVITTPISMSATSMSILLNGAIPIFADIDSRTFNIDPVSVEKLITKKTRAILSVNLFGGPCDFEALKKIARKHKIILIDDNAQGIGGTYKKRPLGTLADIGIF